MAQANRLYHAAEYGTLTAVLPTLLTDLHTAAEAERGRGRRRMLRLLADAYHPACTLLRKNLGYTYAHPPLAVEGIRVTAFRSLFAPGIADRPAPGGERAVIREPRRTRDADTADATPIRPGGIPTPDRTL